MSQRMDLLLKIQSSPSGVSLQQLADELPGASRRSIQRWVKQLLDDGAIVAEGKGPSRVYKPLLDIKDESDQFPSFIPIASDSEDILAYLNQPLAARKPVGYQGSFLEAYQPNSSYYLSESLRRQLHKIGNIGREGLPAGTYGRDIVGRLLIDLSWASSHLEGNTYSLLDTRELINHGKIAEGKVAIETQMILNHKAAIEMLIEHASIVNFNRYTLLNLHSALSENLLPNPSDEGRVRQHIVSISRSVFHPLEILPQINEMFDLFINKAQEIQDPFEQSFFAMVHIPYLQPFSDVNKRTSRLAANIPLLKHNLCPLTFIDVPEQAYSRCILGVYELTRIELLRDLFVWAYTRSAQTFAAIKKDIAEPDPYRLKYRELIKSTIHQIVKSPDLKPLDIIDRVIQRELERSERKRVRALIIEELQRLHEGVLARYNLRLSEFAHWKRQRSVDL